MNTVIFRTIAPILVGVMLVFSVFVLLRGHDEPGGGFIGGLIAASAIAVYGIATGVKNVRKALIVHPLALAGFGVFIATLSGLFSAGFEVPFLTGLWMSFNVLGTEVHLSTPLVFDIGVYFAVVGTLAAVALSLEDDEEES